MKLFKTSSLYIYLYEFNWRCKPEIRMTTAAGDSLSLAQLENAANK
jgi:hypothetical protein